jgi:hypothetical protein
MEAALEQIKILEKELATTREELGRVQVERDNLIICHEMNDKYFDERVNKLKRELLFEKNCHASQPSFPATPYAGKA